MKRINVEVLALAAEALAPRYTTTADQERLKVAQAKRERRRAKRRGGVKS